MEYELNEHNKREFPPMHTAEHILNQTMVRMFGCPRSKNTHIERKKSKCDYLLEGPLSPEQLSEVEYRVNEVIDQHLPVTIEFLSSKEAAKIVDLSKLPEHVSDMLRIVKIGHYDTCACIGSHVENTSEIGYFKILNTDYTEGRLRLRFKLENQKRQTKNKNNMGRQICITILMCIIASAVWAQGGSVYETRTVKSDILKMERKYAVYLPSGYEESDQSYPVLYLLHGAGDDHTGWVQFGQVQTIADQTISGGKAARMIIVMPDANTGKRGYFNDIEGAFDYEDFFFKELIPHIEKNYRVRTERRYRAVAGLSMGGGGTIFYALHQPDLFAAAAPLSASTGSWTIEQQKERLNNPGISDQKIETYFKRHSINGILNNASEEDLKKIKSIRWYISCGDDDFLYEGNALMHIAFKKKEIPHEYRVKDGAHTWSYWRMELPLVMEFVSKSFTQY